jgi:hypothetical protein
MLGDILFIIGVSGPWGIAKTELVATYVGLVVYDLGDFGYPYVRQPP